MSQGTNRAKIQKFIKSFESETRSLIKEISTLAVWSESSIDVIWMMPYEERAVLGEVVKEKLDLLYGKKGAGRR